VAEATLPAGIGRLIPALARTMRQRVYSDERKTLWFVRDGVLVVVQPDKIVLNRISGRDQAEEIMAWLNRGVTECAKTDEDGGDHAA